MIPVSTPDQLEQEIQNAEDGMHLSLAVVSCTVSNI